MADEETKPVRKRKFAHRTRRKKMDSLPVTSQPGVDPQVIVQQMWSRVSEKPPEPKTEKPAWKLFGRKQKQEVQQAQPVVAPPKPQPKLSTGFHLFGRKPESSDELKVKHVSSRRWWLVILGGVAAASALIPLVLYIMNPRDSMALGGLGIFGLAIGGGLAWWGLQERSTSGLLVVAGGKPIVDRPANALVLHPDTIEFATVENPQGHPMRCRNDNKYYYVGQVQVAEEAYQGMVATVKEAGTRVKQFVLPDTQYRDPRELANLLNLPAHRKLAQREASLFQKIAPWALVAVFGILAILFVTSASPEQQSVSNSTVYQQQAGGSP